MDDSAINGLEGILNGNIPTADNLNVLKSLLECHQVSILLLQDCFISNSSIDLSKKLDDSAINGLEGILNGNIPTADNLNVLKSLLECHQVSILLLQGCFISNSSIDLSKKLDDSAINGLEGILNGNIPTADNLNVLKSLLEWPPSKYSAAGLFHK